MKKGLVITDNEYLLNEFIKIAEPLTPPDWSFFYCCSTHALADKFTFLKPIHLKSEFPEIIKAYDLVISLHCKQLFPAELVKAVRCINIHPGYNPYNRGWFPQVFSIINKLPAGATIHEIDEEIDHGKIIAQQQVEILPWDTSKDIYDRVLKTELILLQENFQQILEGNYTAAPPREEGNLNLKSDFNQLRELNLEENTSAGKLIDRMRALTHEPYSNLFFKDKETGKKVFIKIHLQPED